jgi:GNAT superfamily N-acetyltransferase
MIVYRPIRESDIPQIIELYARYLNGGQSIADSIRAAWADGSYLGYIAIEDGSTLGCMTVRRGIEFTYPHPELEAELAAFTKGKRVAYCDALIVLPGHRGEGAAHVLSTRVRELLVQMSIDYFLAEIWIYPDGHAPAQNVFESIGTILWKRRIDGFYRDLARYGLNCPVCGADCVCGAWVEVMEL